MKSLLPWVCLAAAGSAVVHAEEPLLNYRQGDYFTAANQWLKQPVTDPIVNYYLGRMRLYGFGALKNNSLARKQLTLAAEKGYLPAQTWLARYYMQSEKNPEMAVLWFKKMADSGDLEGQMVMSAAYLSGYGVKKNPEIAKKFYIAAAKNGNALAQYAVAVQFLDSRDRSNKKLGLIWLTKAVNQGLAQAQNDMAALLESGVLVTKDVQAARSLWLKSANQGYVPAMIAVAQDCIAQKEYEAAKTWLAKAVATGDVSAYIAQADILTTPGTPLSNPAEGFRWMLKAAETGSVEAQKALGLFYAAGKGVSVDAYLAKQWQDKALKTAKDNQKKNGSPEIEAIQWLTGGHAVTLAGTAYQLGGISGAWHNVLAQKENNYNPSPVMHEITRQVLYKPQFALANPLNIPINVYFDRISAYMQEGKTRSWFYPRYPVEEAMQALEASHSYALAQQPCRYVLRSGCIFQQQSDFEMPYREFFADKSGALKDYQAVLMQLYGKAILGEAQSQFQLGQLYEHGIGVEKDINQAVIYYQLAAAQQNVSAEYNLGVLYLQGKITPVNYRKGIDWLTDAAFKGSAYAQYALGNLYETGLRDATGAVVIPADHQQAIAMLYLAASNRLGEAEYQLAEDLVQDKHEGLSVAARNNRIKLVKRLYEGSLAHGMLEAALPLAFYQAMESDSKQRNQAFQVATQQAQAGNPDAALLLGMLYERGIGVTADLTNAMHWYQQFPANPVNKFILGTYYIQGKGLEKNQATGRMLLQEAANTGFSYADYNVAVVKHAQGESFISDLDKARREGNSKAGLLLADYYLLKASDPEQMKQSRDIYRYFGEKGDRDAQLKLAFLLERGLGGASNQEEALHWYTLSAEQGQPMAQYLLGQMYQLGKTGQTPDYAQARAWYAKAEQVFAPAAVALGFIYDTVEDDYAKADSHYQLAARLQNAAGQYNAGLIYEQGKGRPVDPVKAKALYEQAANQGFTAAMTRLAGLYFQGVDGQRDFKKALYWYEKAAEGQDRDASYQLGLLFETGVAITRDLHNAVRYYQQAATLGNEKAKMALARMYQYGVGVPKDPQHAADLYRELSLTQNAYAQYQLALLYFHGSLGANQVKEGNYFLQLARTNGNPQAIELLSWIASRKAGDTNYITAISLPSSASLAWDHSVDLMYWNAMNEWNRGNELQSRQILSKLLTTHPDYEPVKWAL